jgi:hypothetical protein
MQTWWRPLDSLLRGNLGRGSKDSDQAIDFPVFQIIALTIGLAFVFGASLGSFTAVSSADLGQGLQQLLASTLKAPLLFYLTLVVTFPSLYVFNALLGSQLNMVAAFRLLVAAIAVIVAILASLGPIIVFFALSTPEGTGGYRFIWMLVVILATLAGILGLQYLLRMLNRHASVAIESEVPRVEPRPAADAHSADPDREIVAAELTSASQTPAPLRSRPQPAWRPVHSPANVIFRVWVVVFAVVGAQMSWVLRPFIGSPDREFSWFRQRSGNFFQAVAQVAYDLLSGS